MSRFSPSEPQFTLNIRRFYYFFRHLGGSHCLVGAHTLPHVGQLRNMSQCSLLVAELR